MPKHPFPMSRVFLVLFLGGCLVSLIWHVPALGYVNIVLVPAWLGLTALTFAYHVQVSKAHAATRARLLHEHSKGR